MNKRSVLNQQSIVKKKKPNHDVSVFRMIRRIIAVFFDCFILLAVVVVLSISLMYGYHYLHTSPFVSLDKIEVAGVEDKIKQELIDICGLDSASNLFSINLRDLKQKMEKHPWVKSVKLNRRFPHTLFVRVEKQRPSALVIRNGIFYMNQQCELFKQLSELDEVNFPVITGISQQDSIARLQLDRANQVMKIVALQRSPWSLRELSEMHVGADDISLYFNHFPVEIHAMADDLSDKIDGLKKVTEHLRKAGRIHQVTGIDLNYIGGAVVSFKKS